MTRPFADREMADQASGLLIVGASVRAAAQSALRGGYHVVAVDLFADRDLRALAECIKVRRYPADFTAIRASIPSRPMLYTGALENYPDLLDQFQRGAGGPLLGNGGDVVRRVRDPFRVRDTFKQCGILSPALRRRPPPAEQVGQWLRKSFRSAGGRGVRIWQPPVSPSDHDNHGGYFQRFVPGPVCSASFLATDTGCRLLGTTEMLVGCEWAGTADFIYCGSIQRQPSRREGSQWNRIGRTIAREFSLRGLFGVDGILADQTVWPVEINPRYTASMELIEPALDSSLIALHVDACQGGQPVPRPSPETNRRVAGKSILFAPHDLQLGEQFGNVRAFSRRRVQLADLPEPGGIVRRGQPILSVLVTADSRGQVLKELRASSTQLMQQTKRRG